MPFTTVFWWKPGPSHDSGSLPTLHITIMMVDKQVYIPFFSTRSCYGILMEFACCLDALWKSAIENDLDKGLKTAEQSQRRFLAKGPLSERVLFSKQGHCFIRRAK